MRERNTRTGYFLPVEHTRLHRLGDAVVIKACHHLQAYTTQCAMIFIDLHLGSTGVHVAEKGISI